MGGCSSTPSQPTFLIASVFVQAVQALLIVAQAFLLASVIVRAFTEAADLAAVMPTVVRLGAVIAARALTISSPNGSIHRTAATAIERTADGGLAAHDEPRARVAGRNAQGTRPTAGPWCAGGLEAYYAQYLPQLVLAVVVPLIVGRNPDRGCFSPSSWRSPCR